MLAHRRGAIARTTPARALVERDARHCRDVWLRFASPPIRNAGTMGGNVANGSPIGDTPPVLIALGARLVLRRGARACARCRWRTSSSTTCKKDLRAGRVRRGDRRAAARAGAPTCAPTRSPSASTSDISAVCGGFAIALDGGARRRGARWPSAAWPRRSSAPPQAEAALVGTALDAEQRSTPQARAGRGLHSRSPTCARAPPTGCRWRRTCCSGCGSKRARRRALPRRSDQRLERDAARRPPAQQEPDHEQTPRSRLLQPAEAFADYLTNTAARIDARCRGPAHDERRARRHQPPARVGAPPRRRRGHLHRRHPRTRAARCTARWACRRSPTAGSRRVRPRRHPRRCRAWSRCSSPTTSRAATTAARSSTRTASLPTRTSRSAAGR